MDEKDDSAWVFDSLIGFLQGPVWSAPLLTFIEEKSLIFEADTEDSEDYQRIYQEYKNLVDLLLGCFMEDMGITPEQFEHACAVNKNIKMPIQFQQNLFEQIWAANEYEVFKRMMIQKNLELQLQALNMIEQKYGLTPASLVYESDGLQDDELVMEEITQQVTGAETVMPPQTSLIDEHLRLTTEYKNERALLEEALKLSTQSSAVSSPEEEVSCSSHETIQLPMKPLTPIVLPKPKEKPQSPVSVTETELSRDNATEEEIKRRQDYLKARRDKLVALKKEARSQRLEKNTNRPSSARVVAEATLKGKQELDSPQNVEPSILQVRKALAERLKAEVVHK